MRDKALLATIVGYAIAAIVVFGYSWNHGHDNHGDLPFSTQDERNFYRALGCAIAWPLYVSVLVFEGPPK